MSPSGGGSSSGFSQRPSQESSDRKPLEFSLLHEVSKSLRQNSVKKTDILVPERTAKDVESAMRDFSMVDDQSRLAWNFLTGIAGSKIFARGFWQKQPLLIRREDSKGWAEGAFTVEKDLKLVDGSFITGFKTADVLRNGTRNDTWALSPLKETAAQRTQWSNVAEAMDGGTIYFNTAGTLWKNLGGLCRMMGYAFGLPPNINVYVTPPGTFVKLS